MELEQAGRISVGVMVHALFLIITLPRILAIKRDSTTAIAWLGGVVMFPYVGAVLFWMLGDPAMRRPLRRVISGPAIHFTRKRMRRRAHFPRLRGLMDRLGETPETVGNRVRIVTSGPRHFRSLAHDLERARHEICLQYYIIRPDTIGRALAAILTRKAREGVTVSVLYDAMGSHSLPRAFLNDLRRAGVRFHPFLPLSILRRRVQINFRNHRKLVVIDRSVAHTGGFNIGREYANLSKGDWAGRWFDAHCRIEGPAVEHLLEEFAADWAFASGDESEEIEAEPAWLDEPRGENPHDPSKGWVMTVSGGPDQQINRIRAFLFWAFTHAKKRIWIASPYYVPDQGMMDSLVTAVNSGVEVRILTQNNSPDKWIPYYAASYFVAPLIEAGAQVYQYQPGMMHAKMFLVDDRLASIGSANLDVRSLSLNFELNCVFSSPAEILHVESLFETAFDSSWLVTPEALAARSWPRRVIENFCRLFAPVL